MNKETKIKNGDSLVAELKDLIRTMTADLTDDMQRVKEADTDSADWMIYSIRADCTKRWLQNLAEIVANAQAFIRPLNLE